MMHEVAYLLGLTDPSGWPYLAWSGILGRVVIPTAFFRSWMKHHQCAEPKCRRLGHPDQHGHVACKDHKKPRG